jgi:hypothetical protein
VKIFLHSLIALGGKCLNFLTVFDHVISSKRKLIDNSFEIPSGLKMVVSYAHFDAEQEFNLQDRNSIKQFLEYSDLVVVSSNVNSLDSEDNLIRVQRKKNLGFDLGLHRDTLREMNRKGNWPDYLVLTNSSLIWDEPIGFKKTINEIFSRINLHGEKFIFLTDSYQPKWHNQSYFLFVDCRTQESREIIFKQFEKVKNWRFKRSAVFWGEKRILTGIVRMAKCHTMYSMSRILFESDLKITPKKIAGINPSQNLRMELKSMGASFSKKPRMSVRARIFRN